MTTTFTSDLAMPTTVTDTLDFDKVNWTPASNQFYIVPRNQNVVGFKVDSWANHSWIAERFGGRYQTFNFFLMTYRVNNIRGIWRVSSNRPYIFENPAGGSPVHRFITYSSEFEETGIAEYCYRIKLAPNPEIEVPVLIRAIASLQLKRFSK